MPSSMPSAWERRKMAWLMDVQDIWQAINRCFLPTSKDGGYVTYKDKGEGKIIGEGDNRYVILQNPLRFTCWRFKPQFVSISQLCGKANKVIVESSMCSIQSTRDNQFPYNATRNGKAYNMNFDYLDKQNVKCFSTIK